MVPLAVLLALLQASSGGRFVVDGEKSQITIEVGRAGLLSFAGHEHTVSAAGLAGEVVVDPDQVERSWVRVSFPASGLRVTASEGPSDDIPKIQATMAGPKVLDAGRFAEIRFASTSVSGQKREGETWEIALVGDLDLHGVRKSIRLPLKATLAAESLVVEGTLKLAQRDFGIDPVSVGGVVKVKNELAVTLRIVARPAP